MKLINCSKFRWWRGILAILAMMTFTQLCAENIAYAVVEGNNSGGSGSGPRPPEPGGGGTSPSGTLAFYYGEPTGIEGTDWYSAEDTGNSLPPWVSSGPYTLNISAIKFDSSFANARPKSCYCWFRACSNVSSIDGIEYLNTSEVTDMSMMFAGCGGLRSLNLSGFDTRKVTSMRGMFECCQFSTLDVSSFNTANVTDMSDMFAGCIYLSTLDLSNFNTARVTNMSSMFRGHDWWDTGMSDSRMALTSITFGPNFTTANVTNMSEMFMRCSNLTSIDLSKFNTSKVTSMSYMFFKCSALTNLDLSGFNTSNVTDMSYMVYQCTGLTSLDVSRLSVSNVTNMDYMFAGFDPYDLNPTPQNMALTMIYCPNDWNTANVTSSTGMFDYSPNLSSLSSNVSYSSSNANDKTFANPDTGYFTYKIGYAVLDNGTLTFRWDDPRELGTEGVDYYQTDNTGTTSSSSPAWRSNNTSVTSVVFDASFANARPKSCYRWFYGCTNLASITGLDNLNTSQVTDFSSMFYNCNNANLTTLDVGGWDTGKAEKFFQMFQGCNKLTSLDVSSWDVHSASNMGSMFYNCSKLTTLAVDNWNTQSATNMSGMFGSCKGLTSLNVSNWNTSSVTNVGAMFDGCSGLTFLDVSNWNVGKVTTLSYTFNGCSNLETLDVSGWRFNQTNYYLTNLSSAFAGCKKLNALDVSGWDVSRVTTLNKTFYQCEKLTALAVDNWNTAAVTDMASTFSGCKAIATLNVGSWNTAAVTDMASTFSGCKAIATLNVGSWNTAAVTDMASTFSGCKAIATLNVGSWNTAKVTTMLSLFDGCDAMETFDVGNWNVGLVKKFDQMFYHCDNLITVDVSEWNTVSLESMNSMFYACSKLTTLDLSNWNTAKVNTMNAVFQSCFALDGIDISNWNTENVTNMANMFNNCHALSSLDVSHLNTRKVTTMQGMFQNCRELTHLTFGADFTTPVCMNFSNTFSGCSKMRYLDFYDSNDGVSGAFSNSNINRTASGSAALFGNSNSGLPMTTVVYLPHGIRKGDYTASSYLTTPNLVYVAPEEGGLVAYNYSSEDKVDIELPRAFNASIVGYTRTMNAATQYGTTILPYAFTTNDEVQAYTLDHELTDQMYFTEATTIPAHTPFFYKKKNATATSVIFRIFGSDYENAVAATHSTSSAEGGTPYVSGSGMDGWTTKGYYITETIDASDGQTFYISGDKFLLATGTLKMNPHRVTFHGTWEENPFDDGDTKFMEFQTLEAPAGTEEPTQDDEPSTDEELPEEIVTALEAADLRKEASEAVAIYDAQGRVHSGLQKGLNIIRKQDGSVKKVVIR